MKYFQKMLVESLRIYFAPLVAAIQAVQNELTDAKVNQGSSES